MKRFRFVIFLVLVLILAACNIPSQWGVLPNGPVDGWNTATGTPVLIDGNQGWMYKDDSWQSASVMWVMQYAAAVTPSAESGGQTISVLGPMIFVNGNLVLPPQ